MRIHVQNPPDDPVFAITPAQWKAAVARNPEEGRRHDMTFADDPAGFAAAIGAAEVLVSWTKIIHDNFIARPPPSAPKLRLISATSAGLDRLLPMDWVPPGVDVLNNRGTHGAKAGEYALMALLMLVNRMPAHIANQAREIWAPGFSSTLAGRSVMVVGLGTLGGAAAEQAARVGARVTGVNFSGRPYPACTHVVRAAEIETALPETQFLVIACPLTAESRNLLSRERLSLLPKGAGVVNIGRGAIWDQDAVCDLLDAGHLSGAVSDVFVPEPLPPGHRVWRTPNFVVTPHCSSDDPTTYNDLTLDILLRNLTALREGRTLPNRVDPAKGY